MAAVIEGVETTSEYQKRYYLENRQKRSEYYKKYYLRNKQKIVERTKEYNKRHPKERGATSESSRRWREKNPQKVKLYSRAYGLKKHYALSLEDYDRLFEQQNGLCAVCGSEEGSRKLAVDHCHVTGSVRGLLCISCNTLLGMLESKPDWVIEAQKYLEEKKWLEQ